MCVRVYMCGGGGGGEGLTYTKHLLHIHRVLHPLNHPASLPLITGTGDHHTDAPPSDPRDDGCIVPPLLWGADGGIVPLRYFLCPSAWGRRQ